MKKLFKLLAFIFLALIIQSFLANLYKNFRYTISDCDEYTVHNTSNNQPAVTHQRYWKDRNHSERFCMDYAYEDSKWLSSTAHRNNLKTPKAEAYNEYWGKIYGSLYKHDSTALNTIRDSLLNIRTQKQLDKTAFAHMIVKFVQDIPYSYILSEPCEKVKDGNPCTGESRFGILSPVEFLYTLQGDCDTRTVLLYGILKDLGYEPLVLISREYLHSILALNIPSAGDHISHQGKKFYFWETTNTGWEPGMIAPDMKNIAYWDIALD